MKPGALIREEVVVDRCAQQSVPELARAPHVTQGVRVNQVAEERIQPYLVDARDLRERVGVHASSIHGRGPRQLTRTGGKRVHPGKEEVGQLLGDHSWPEHQ
jgi:hypothetical protein